MNKHQDTHCEGHSGRSRRWKKLSVIPWSAGHLRLSSTLEEANGRFGLDHDPQWAAPTPELVFRMMPTRQYC